MLSRTGSVSVQFVDEQAQSGEVAAIESESQALVVDGVVIVDFDRGWRGGRDRALRDDVGELVVDALEIVVARKTLHAQHEVATDIALRVVVAKEVAEFVGGFVGVVGVLTIYFVLFMQIVQNAQTAPDRGGMYICMCICSTLLFHLLVNVGMVVGRMPVTGIPLPLMSNGGSGMLSVFLMLGLVNNVRLRRFVN